MKVLVTGSSGFVGQHLVRFLTTKKCRVSGTFHKHRPAAISGIDFHHCNFFNHKDVLHLLKKIRPDHIVHLVGQSSPGLSWKKPYETIQGNVFSTFHLLDACRELNLKPKILYVSSAHVYGQSFYEHKNVSETILPKPLDPYATSKIQAEYFVLQYWYQFKIPSFIMRASAHTGIGQPPFFVISNFCKQIAEIEMGKQEPVIFVGNLNVERGFVAVEDMVRAYWLALKGAKPGEIYNVGATRVKKMSSWLNQLLELSPVKVKVRMDPARKRLKEPLRIAIDSTKFRKLTRWKESVPLSGAFQNVLNWWRKYV